MDWVRRFRHGGYDELLAIKPRGRHRKMSKSTSRISKGKSEIDRLKEENEYLKAENAYLKKLKALDQEDAGMFGIGPKSSGN
jgi:transposase